MEVKTILLRVTGNGLSGTAHWSRHGSSWKCSSASHNLRWMIRCSPAEARDTLRAAGARYRWISSRSREAKILSAPHPHYVNPNFLASLHPKWSDWKLQAKPGVLTRNGFIY